MTIPAPGDYDGDGETDLAVYVPQSALCAYRPSGAASPGADIWTTFGIVVDGQTVLGPSIPSAQPPVVSASTLATLSAAAGVPIAFGATDVAGFDGASLVTAKKSKRA